MLGACLCLVPMNYLPLEVPRVLMVTGMPPEGQVGVGVSIGLFVDEEISLIYFTDPLVGAVASLSFLWFVELISQLFELYWTISYFSLSLFSFFIFSFVLVLTPFCSYLLCTDVMFDSPRVLFTSFSPI